MTIEARERLPARALSTGAGGQRIGPLDPELSEHEAWRALCQLEARERRGEAMAAVDAVSLRRHLEARVRAELPGLSHHLPAPLVDTVRPWPLLVAVAVAGQGSGGFRTGLRIKPPRPSTTDLSADDPAAVVNADGPTPLPPFTVAPAPVQPASRRAAALVRAELDRRAAPDPQRLNSGLRQRLLKVAVPAPLPEVAPPLAAPHLPEPPASEPRPETPSDDLAARLRQVEIESAELTIRSVAMGASPFAYHPGRVDPPPPPVRDNPFAARGIVVDVAVDDPSDAPGLEGGLLHQEEAEVTIISTEPPRLSMSALVSAEAHAGASSSASPDGLFEEAEVEIVLPGGRPRSGGHASAAPTVDRFLGALISKP